MKWVLYKLNKILREEVKWKRYERVAVDLKTKEGVRMALERIPQLQTAIELLTNHLKVNRSETGKEAKRRQPKDHPANQLTLFK